MVSQDGQTQDDKPRDPVRQFSVESLFKDMKMY